MNYSAAQIASDMIPSQCPGSPATSVSQEQTGYVSGDSSPSKAALAATGNFSVSSLQDDTASEAPRDGSDNSDGGSNAVKKLAWNKPNGVMEIGPVMGAMSWPALSESTKASPKFATYDPPRTPSDRPAASSKGTSAPTTPSPKHLHANHTTLNSTQNHVPSRHRSNKRAGGNSSSTALPNGSTSQTQPLHSSVVESAPGKSNVESHSRDNVFKEGGQVGGFGSQSHGGNDQHYVRGSPRKGGNNRPRPRGDGTYHQERGNQDWNHNRSYGNRDAHLQPLRVPSRPFLRGPPPPSPPFISPLMPMRPMGSHMMYPVPPPMYYVPGPGPQPDPLAMPMLPSPPPGVPVIYHFLDPILISKIVNQIDYYFSSENLIKDMYLRKEMDQQGWVPVKLIASFKKVAELTDDIELIVNALKTSSVVEVQHGKLRVRNDWAKWILPATIHYSSLSSPRSDVLRQQLQSVTLDEQHQPQRQSNAEQFLSRSSITAQGISASSSSN
ncbi:unnamed protein product [Cuscuta europaea]|uniref:HTH La-type RNA-binding domain-containing protein n=1 Tax=Cuscuta europaea TaxID=41803 RepID=A0A9P0ZMU3_CUSEU|nr:unnamed protein product [Cuscuta europaea]